MPEHPDIEWAERLGYPYRMTESDAECDLEAYEAYCDRAYEESRDRRLFGD